MPRHTSECHSHGKPPCRNTEAECELRRSDKEVFETEEGKAILRDLGIDDTKYVGIGNCILGYVKGDYPVARPRKDNYIYWIK